MAEEEQLKSGANKKAKLSLLLGVILMLALGGGGFFLVYSGALFPSDEGRLRQGGSAVDGGNVTPLPNVAFIPIDPLIVNLVDTSGQNRHLRFQVQLEVPAQYKQEVETLLPRLVDVLNGYLRAVEVSELESPSALVRLRAQILRRLQIVAGEGRVNDVLIMEFVIN